MSIIHSSKSYLDSGVSANGTYQLVLPPTHLTLPLLVLFILCQLLLGFSPVWRAQEQDWYW